MTRPSMILAQKCYETAMQIAYIFMIFQSSGATAGYVNLENEQVRHHAMATPQQGQVFDTSQVMTQMNQSSLAQSKKHNSLPIPKPHI